jgi:hypothetical protein
MAPAMPSQPYVPVCVRHFTRPTLERSRAFMLATGFAALALAAHGCDASLPSQPASGLPGLVEIEALVATQTYLDTNLEGVTPLDTSQLQIWFDAPPGEIGPADIESIHVDGPNGASYPIGTMQLTNASLNGGYVRNQAQDYFWYQRGLIGFLPAGRYTATVKFRDGSTSFASREVEADRSLLADYLALRDQLEYMPSGGASTSSDAHSTVLEWTTLASRGGQDAFYTAWISTGETQVVDGKTVRGGDIFLEAAEGDTTAGRNATSMAVSTSENPLTAGPQTWQAQITNSNVLDEIDMMIFSPPQHFTAE